MLTIEEFDSLEVGDQIATAPLFPALTPDDIMLRTTHKASDRAEFVVTFLGVTLGKWVAQKSQGGLSWAFT